VFKRHKSSAPSKDLLKSGLFDEQLFYKTFIKDIKHAKSSILIESPFMTERKALQFARLFKSMSRRGVVIRVNTRNPRHHDRFLEVQAWKALYILRDCGVKVRTYNDLRHRKLSIIDDEVLWEGSLNILSQNNSKEIMRRSESGTLCKQMLKFTKANNWF
jgi:hypothetical protein